MSQKEQEQRSHARKTMAATVRYSAATDTLKEGSIINISYGSILILGRIAAGTGETVNINIEDLGELSGKVTRKVNNAFALEYEMPASLKPKLDKLLGARLDDQSLEWVMERRTLARVQVDLQANVRLKDQNASIVCDIDNISETGIALKSKTKPDLGVEVQVGFLHGAVKRHTDDGFAIEFS